MPQCVIIPASSSGNGYWSRKDPGDVENVTLGLRFSRTGSSFSMNFCKQ